jgi:sugar-specific transcriptional regulator TrmB
LAQTGVPGDVRRFIAAEIQSVGQLEVLLLLRGVADKSWTADEVARALVMQAPSVASWLETMARRGLVAADGGTYRYAPPTAEVERTVDRLAESYAKYRVAVIGTIFSRPSEGVTRFSEAFRVRREDN